MHNKSYFLPFLFLVAFCLSCANEKQEKLLGVWEYILPPEITRPPDWLPVRGYHFVSTDTLEVMPGYFEEHRDTLTKTWRFEYLGSLVKYRIHRGNLEYQELGKGKRIVRKIISISEDTLVLAQGPDYIEKFVKIKQLGGSFRFDRIVLSSHGGYGRFPVLRIAVSRTGELIYYGEKFTLKSGLFRTQLAPETTRQIFRRFEIADIGHLKSKYTREYHDEWISAHFTSDIGDQKTIHDYGKASPTPFLWACELLRWLPDNLSMEKIPIDSSRWAITRDSIFGPVDRSPW